MKFNVSVPKWRQEFLENEYKEYIKKPEMTKKEQRALRKWVKDGNSVYENSCEAWYKGQVPICNFSKNRDGQYDHLQFQKSNLFFY